jgi:hypothetical protein
MANDVPTAVETWITFRHLESTRRAYSLVTEGGLAQSTNIRERFAFFQARLIRLGDGENFICSFFS